MSYAIGLDIGGTKIAAGIVNQSGDIIHKVTLPSDVSNKESMFRQVIYSVNELMNTTNILKENIIGLGAGVPGKVDRENGIAVYQNNLPWAGFPFKDRLQEALGIERIEMDNDVYMAAFAEWKNTKISREGIFVYLTISTGISCSIIQGGTFIRGAGFSGEIGLIPMKQSQGDKGWKTLENVASGPAIEALARNYYLDEQMTAADVFTRFYAGDEKARQILEETAAYIAHGVYMLTCVVDPEKVVFGGSVANHNPQYLEMIKEQLSPLLLKEQQHILHGIKGSHLKADQGIIGAGLRVFD